MLVTECSKVDELTMSPENMAIISQPENVEKLHQEEIEQKAMLRLKAFRDTGSAYMQEHATRTATIGLALSASPIALLSW